MIFIHVRSFNISYKYCLPNRRVKKEEKKRINRYDITNKVAPIQSFDRTKKRNETKENFSSGSVYRHRFLIAV